MSDHRPTDLRPPTPDPTASPLHLRQQELDPVYAALRALLVWGFRIGAALLLLGIALSVVTGEPLHQAADPFRDVVPAVLAGKAAGVVDLAILWLMTVPVLAVILVAAGFARIGDWRYAVASALVLATLAASTLVTGKGAGIAVIVVISAVGLATVLAGRHRKG